MTEFVEVYEFMKPNVDNTERLIKEAFEGC